MLNINDYFDFTPRDRTNGLTDNQAAIAYLILIAFFVIVAYLVDFNI